MQYVVDTRYTHTWIILHQVTLTLQHTIHLKPAETQTRPSYQEMNLLNHLFMKQRDESPNNAKRQIPASPVSNIFNYMLLFKVPVILFI